MTVKGHFKESVMGMIRYLKTEGLTEGWEMIFKMKYHRFHLLTVKYRQVQYHIRIHIIWPLIWKIFFGQKFNLNVPCTLYKSSKAGLCLDLMILSKLSKACQNFCQTNWNIKRLHFVCWRWLFWLLKIFKFDLIKIIAPVSKYSMTSWFYQSDINWNIWVIIQGHPVTKGVAVLVIFWTESKFYPHFDPVFSIPSCRTLDISTIIQRLYENWLVKILTTVT